MNTFASNGAFSIQDLLLALTRMPPEDRMNSHLTASQWQTLGMFLRPMVVQQGHVLFAQGELARAVYFVEAGAVTIHSKDEQGQVRMAIVSEGEVLGEAGFFSQQARTATAQVNAPSRIWTLDSIKLTEMVHRHPGIAFGLSMSLGSVLSKRMQNPRRRWASV